MELKKVKLYNFTSYAGEANFDFSTTSSQNIILIGGNNGTGKTSLFTAIKLALYGPLCFHYQGKNAQYSARLKELMNHEAFTEAEVKTYVEVDVMLPVRQTCSVYTIHREWSYIGKKIRETYWVSDGGNLLADRERDYFQNYLFTVIPPNMFEFFFFDGEEISNFFSDSSYNAYIKNAVLTLCGYDTFGLIKKFCDTYVGGEFLDAEYSHLLEELNAKGDKLEKVESEILAAQTALKELEQKKLDSWDAKEHLEAQFKRSGGLSKNKHDVLTNKMSQHDRRKSECAKIIRDYAEGMMPFYITYDLSRAIDEQLLREDRMRQYQTSTRLLSVSMLKEAVSAANVIADGKIDALSQRLYNSIATTLCPEEHPDAFQFIHDLSDEQRKQVSAILVELYGFVPHDIIQAIQSKKDAAEKYEKVQRELRESLPSIDANTFFEKFSVLSTEISEYDSSIAAAQQQLGRLEEEKLTLNKTTDALRAQIQAADKNKMSYRFTSRISSMMDNLITDVVRGKFQQIEQLTLQMFHKITHKDNFVDLMELDDSFNISMYKAQRYTMGELYALLEHIGPDELQARLGNTGMQILLAWFNISSPRMLRKTMKNSLAGGTSKQLEETAFDLYKKVELSQLSKGERQVFLLSLYWAIIKSSGQAVPFIIDTPFARIDTEHREQLTKCFFSSVSEQVIILSTDEEVVDLYHTIIQDKTAHEYLLSNEAATGHTTVRPGYFAKEGSL